MYKSIHAQFRELGIEMPCPTQEVLVRMLEPEPRREMPIADLHSSLESALKQAGVSV